MEAADDCCSFKCISQDGSLDVNGIENFINVIELGQCGSSYAVVSIMGPQSSGKSTLLNRLFSTNFTQLEGSTGKFQTTRGVWLAKADDGFTPRTLVLDLEGCDGSERGEDDKSFENKIALFALAVSDIMIINLWCNDIGRDSAACKPLLRTIFQVYAEDSVTERKTTLMFVIRDYKPKPTPKEKLEEQLKKDIKEIWGNVPKRREKRGSRFSDSFNIEFHFLSDFWLMEEQFVKDVDSLKRSILFIFGGLDARDILVGDIPTSFHRIWTSIKENEDLNLPEHKVMVSTIRCDQIANKIYSEFKESEKWSNINEEARSGPSERGFGNMLHKEINHCIKRYEEQTELYDAHARATKKEKLVKDLYLLGREAALNVLEHIRSATLELFKKELNESLERKENFDSAAEGCFIKCLREFNTQIEDAVIKEAKWDISYVGKQLRSDIAKHIASVGADQLAKKIGKIKSEQGKSEALQKVAGVLAGTGSAVAGYGGVLRLMGSASTQIIELIISAATALNITVTTGAISTEALAATAAAAGVIGGGVVLAGGIIAGTTYLFLKSSGDEREIKELSMGIQKCLSSVEELADEEQEQRPSLPAGPSASNSEA